MSNSENSTTCALNCWLMGLGAGLLVSALLVVLGSWSLVQAGFVGVLTVIIAGASMVWLACPSGSQQQTAAVPVAAARAAEPMPEAEPVETASVAKVATAEPSAEAPTSATAVKSGTLLAGEEELAARKGTWSYAVSEDVAPAAEAPTEVEAEASGPESLSAPRGGEADDLKKIKGVGPKLESLLHSMGFYHFDQIANWSKADVAWADENLEGFKGRVSRDNWVEQAKALASGEETEVSKRVEEDGVS